MNRTRFMLGGATLALVLSLGGQASAQEIDFGDDSSTFANDQQCDDPRFEGPGAAILRSPVDEMRDATDCRAAFEAGTVTLVSGEAEADAATARPAGADDIDFGDDSGAWANDGECDDPRFGGSLSSHERADATDCRNAYEAGEVTYMPPEATGGDEIDFGDDSGAFANDGECDDPRFGGGLASHEMADATDCRNAYETGEVIYTPSAETTPAPAPDLPIGDIDFGDDSGNWANDGECDDPRFGGTLESHRFADATDCRNALEAGEVTFLGDEEGTDTPSSDPIIIDGIDFGDDSGNWANDGECDDPRFGGALESHRFADATDCRNALEAGEVTFLGDDEGTDTPSSGPIIIDGIDFGDDSGNWANDGECDDPRFTGSGMGVALDDHLMADATDCSTAYEEGTVTLADDSETGGNGDSAGFRINFGDDSGSSAHDGICDDPRFQGRGAAAELYDSNLMADATDCRAAYEAGTVTYEP